jgi:hypothetical protein
MKQVTLPEVLRRLQHWDATLLHPTLRRCPAYYKGCSYAGGPARVLLKPGCYFWNNAQRSELGLLASEVWDLLPWQLDVLGQHEQLQQEFAQQLQAARRTTTGLPKSSSSSGDSGGSSSSSSGDWHRPDMVYSVSWPLLPQAWPLLQASSSSSSSSGSSSRLREPPTAQLPRVTQQQLQLALERVCSTAELSPINTGNSLLLLVLLLLRAEPPQRLAFLQGPWGGLLLAALQLYARGQVPLHFVLQRVEQSGVPHEYTGWHISRTPGFEGFAEMLSPLGGADKSAQGATAGWALSWLLLQPKDAVQAKPVHSSSSSSSSSTANRGDSTSSSSSSSSSTANRGDSSSAGSTGPAQGTSLSLEDFWQPGTWVHFGTAATPAGGQQLIAWQCFVHLGPCCSRRCA